LDGRDHRPGRLGRSARDKPCERGHGRTEIGNKHCRPIIEIRKEQSERTNLAYTHDPVSASLGHPDFCYRVTVTSLSNVQWTLDASDAVCDPSQDAHVTLPFSPSGTQTLFAFGTVVYTCSIDPVAGAGILGDSIPQAGGSLTNTVMVTATPNDNSGAVQLTDAVTANFS
jgi:hypothetical protein